MYRSRIISRGESVTSFDMPSLDMTEQECVNEDEHVETETDEEPLQQKVERMEREAYENGFRAGEKAGFAIGEEKAKVLVNRLEAILIELTSLKEKTVKDLESQIMELALSIAKKVIGEELTITPGRVVEITKNALMKLDDRTGQIKIKINPSVHELFMKHKKEILDIHPDVIFDVDNSVSESGPVVIGPSEDVVTDIDEQLRNLIKEMAERNGGN